MDERFDVHRGWIGAATERHFLNGKELEFGWKQRVTHDRFSHGCFQRTRPKERTMPYACQGQTSDRWYMAATLHQSPAPIVSLCGWSNTTAGHTIHPGSGRWQREPACVGVPFALLSSVRSGTLCG